MFEVWVMILKICVLFVFDFMGDIDVVEYVLIKVVDCGVCGVFL